MERVLVIDDDVGLCELVGEYLEPEGYTVEAIHNGDEPYLPLPQPITLENGTVLQNPAAFGQSVCVMVRR